MKPKFLAVAAALGASLLAAVVLPGHVASGVLTPSRPTAAYPVLVRVTSFITNDTSWAQPAAQRDRMRAAAANSDPQALRRRRISASSCTNPGAGTGAYNLTGTRVNGPTTAHLNPTGAPGGAASALQTAFNTWRAADAAAPAISVVSDGAAGGATANHRFDVVFKAMGTRTLASTYTWSWGGGVYENDMVFNRSMPWFNAPGEGDGCYEGVSAFDVLSVATHEAGHVYGLAHVSSAFNTMAPTATMGETYKRSLASGDAAGIQHIY